MEKESLLEKSGYSFSGISNIVNNQPEDAKALLREIDAAYCKTHNRINELEQQKREIEEELKREQKTKGFVVSSFLHYAKVIKSKALVFETEGKVVFVVVSENYDSLTSYLRDRKIEHLLAERAKS